GAGAIDDAVLGHRQRRLPRRHEQRDEVALARREAAIVVLADRRLQERVEVPVDAFGRAFVHIRPGRTVRHEQKIAYTLRMARLLCVALLGALASTAWADLRSGDDKALHGDYAEAAQAYRAVKGKDAPRAQLHLGRVLLQTGDYAGAEAVAEAAAKD